MAIKVTTTVINMNEVDWDGEEDTRDLLKPVAECGAEVIVLCEATDGYYDVQLPNGAIVNALSWYHLDGFTENGIAL